MDYLTVKEVSVIKECSERYIKRLCKDVKLESIQTTSCKGRMKYMVPVSALSEQEQAIYYSKMKKRMALFLLRLRRKPQNAVRTPQKDDLKTTQRKTERKSCSGQTF